MHEVKAGELLRAALTRGDKCIVLITTRNAGAGSFAEQVFGAHRRIPVITQNNFAGWLITAMCIETKK
jgi:hypothetical protein